MSRIIIEPKVLGDSLAAVKPALGRRNAVGALSGVRLTTSVTDSHLTTTDSDTFARKTLSEGEAEGEMDCVVAHHELANVAKVFSSEPCINLALEKPSKNDERLVCSHGQRKIVLPTQKLQNLPPFPALGDRQLLTANGAELATAIERVGRFISSDQTRPTLCGINVDWNDGLVLVGTDSKRLAVIPAPGTLNVPKQASTDKQDPNRITIEGRGLLLAAKAMRKADRVRVLAGETHAIVEWDGNLWAIRLDNGFYPRWRELIPITPQHRITIPASELAQASELAVKFLPGSTPARLLVNGVVKLHGGTRSGPAFEQILKGANADLGDQKTLEIGFNAEFLHSIAQGYLADTAVVRIVSPRHPALFEDQDDRYLLMPIRLDT